MKYFLFLAALCAPPSAHAKWNSASTLYLQNLSEVKFNNPYMATFWASVHSATRVGSPAQAQVYRLKSPDFDPQGPPEEHGLPVSVTLQKDAQGHTLTRPLVFFTPGFSSNHLDHWSRSAIARFYKLGFHVVTLPNPVSTDWVGQNYKSNPGDPVTEAATLHFYMQSLVEKIGPMHIAKVHLAGESYGAFLTALVANRDVALAPEDRLLSEHDSKILLESPPVNFLQTLTRLDAEMDLSHEAYFAQCRSRLSRLSFAASTLFSNGKTDLKQSTLDCARALVLHEGFRRRLAEIANLYEEIKGVELMPKEPVALEAWTNNLRMLNFFATYSPEAIATLHHPQIRNLGYWLREFRAQSQIPLHIISAVDDFINDPAVWKNQEFFNFEDSHTLFFPWGGHMGFQVTQEYGELMRLNFCESASQP